MTDLSISGTQPLVPAFGVLQKSLAPFVEPVIRVTAGLLLVPHGAQKLFGWFGGYGLEATGQYFASIGFPAWTALAVGLVEFAGGLLLALGLGTRIAAGFIAGFLAVAVTQHYAAGFFWNEG